MTKSRLGKLLESSSRDRLFSSDLYKVRERNERGFGIRTVDHERHQGDATGFHALVTRPSRPDDQEWRAMEEEIKLASYILSIQNDDESDEFVAYSRNTLARAIDFLRRQMIHAHAANVVGMGVPRICPADSGSIDLYWEKSDRTLLINFPAGDHLPSYYGRKPKSEVSGRFDPSDARAELVFWLAD